MTVWVGVITFLLVFVTVALIGLILIQRGKGGGLAGVFGGGGVEQAFGTRATTLAQKATAVLGAAFLILAGLLGWLWQRSSTRVEPLSPGETETAPGPETPAAAPEAPAAPAPAAPAQGGQP